MSPLGARLGSCERFRMFHGRARDDGCGACWHGARARASRTTGLTCLAFVRKSRSQWHIRPGWSLQWGWCYTSYTFWELGTVH